MVFCTLWLVSSRSGFPMKGQTAQCRIVNLNHADAAQRNYWLEMAAGDAL
jgi:hypothetical protein